MRYAMIMAGGAGTRLWPLSRQSRPKQLLRFIRRGRQAETSLLELAAGRLDGLIDADKRYICTGERYRASIREAIPALADAQILGEPTGRDTVNAVGFAAAVFQKLDPDAVFAVLTADHVIEPDNVFRERMDAGFRLAEQDPNRLITFSITPTYAATGYGYVERGTPLSDHRDDQGQPIAHRVARFVEKPDQHRAEAYFRSGHFGWNSGMFVFHAGTFLDCLRKHKPESHDGLMRIQAAWGTPEQRAVLDEVYPTLPRISVDYAVMEPASTDKSVSICMVDMPVDWLDVGSWPSYGQTLESGEDANRVAGAGETLVVDGSGNLVVSAESGHTVAVLGAKDLIVVHTPDATLVMPRAHAERLKDLHARLPDGLK
jgi:mannose-1-phosphate guanylyltransferase